jgi:hypothetical protein
MADSVEGDGLVLVDRACAAAVPRGLSFSLFVRDMSVTGALMSHRRVVAVASAGFGAASPNDTISNGGTRVGGERSLPHVRSDLSS